MQKINDFYSDAANLNIQVIDAVYIVRAQVHGQNPQLIDAQIRYLRMLAISHQNYLIEFPSLEIYKNPDNVEKLKKNPYTYIFWPIASCESFTNPKDFVCIKHTKVGKQIMDEIKWNDKNLGTLVKKVVQEGWVTREDFIKAGYYCGEDGSLQELFCHGDYKLEDS